MAVEYPGYERALSPFPFEELSSEIMNALNRYAREYELDVMNEHDTTDSEHESEAAEDPQAFDDYNNDTKMESEYDSTDNDDDDDSAESEHYSSYDSEGLENDKDEENNTYLIGK